MPVSDSDDRSSAQPVSNNSEPTPGGKPSRPVSARKLAANRANAALSTGPRTPEGKARVAMNAVRHGLASHAPLIPGEDPAELDALAEAYHDDLRPRGALERELVARIIGIAWRLRRVARAEEDMWEDWQEHRERNTEMNVALAQRYNLPVMPGLTDGQTEPLTPARFVQKNFGPSCKNSAIERLAMYEQRLSRGMHAAIRELNAMRKLRGEGEDVDGDEQRSRGADDIAIAQNKPTEPQNSRSVDLEHTDAAAPVGSETQAEPLDAPDTQNAQNKPTVGPPTSDFGEPSGAVGGLGEFLSVPECAQGSAPVDAAVARPHPPSS